MKYDTTYHVPIQIEFNILPPEPPDLPLQVDIVGVYMSLKTDANKPRRINILSALTDSDIMSLEDEILTPAFIKEYNLVMEWKRRNGGEL